MNILQRCQGGVIHILHTHTQKQNRAKCPFHAITPTALDTPFARFTPAALKSFPHPGWRGVPIFDRVSKRGWVPKLYRDSKGWVRIFYRHFSRKVPPPPQQEQSLSSSKLKKIRRYMNTFIDEAVDPGHC